MKILKEFSKKLFEILNVDAYIEKVDELEKRCKRLNNSTRLRLLSICKESLQFQEIRRYEPLRIALIKTLIALVPDSNIIIESLINKKSDQYFYEVHFSLFCFLDQLHQLKGGKKLASKIPFLIEQYLFNVKSNAGNAAWMAGDLLGDHWPLEESLPVLLKSAKNSRFIAGRSSALHGIEEALRKIETSKKKKILMLLKEIYKTDRSSKIKTYSKIILDNNL